MGNTSFTPGPWLINDHDKATNGLRCTIFQRTKAGGFEPEIDIAEVIETYCGTNEARANARLITAAPDMYKELLLIQEGWQKRDSGEVGDPLNMWEAERYRYLSKLIESIKD